MKQYMRNTIHHSCNILPMKDYHCIKSFSYMLHKTQFKTSLQYLTIQCLHSYSTLFSSATIPNVTWIDFHQCQNMRIYPDTGGRLCHALHILTDPSNTHTPWQSWTPLPHCVLHFLHPSYIPYKVAIHISLTIAFVLSQSSWYSFYKSSPVTTRLGSGHAAPECIPGWLRNYQI